MEFNTKFGSSDFAAYYQMRSKLLGTGKDAVGRGAIAAIGCLEMVLGAWVFMGGLRGGGGMMLVMGALFFAGSVFYYPILGWRCVRAMPRDMGEIGYRFDEEGVTQSQSRGSASVAYERIFAAAESREIIALFYDETHGVFFPKKSVPDVEQLRVLLEEKLGFPMKTFSF